MNNISILSLLLDSLILKSFNLIPHQLHVRKKNQKAVFDSVDDMLPILMDYLEQFDPD